MGRNLNNYSDSKTSTHECLQEAELLAYVEIMDFLYLGCSPKVMEFVRVRAAAIATRCMSFILQIYQNP